MPKNKNQKGQSVTVYLSKEVVTEVLKDSEEQDRSVSYVVNKVLEKYYQEEDRIQSGSDS